MSHFNYIDLFGFLAALLTTIAFLPQLYKTWKTKSADDVSLIMLILFITGLIFWIIYGLKIHSIPILVANIARTLPSIAIAKRILKSLANGSKFSQSCNNGPPAIRY